MENLFTKEWLIANGLGGYASGTVQGANTRRYHGLMVASLHPPVERKIMVAKVEERVLLEGTYYDLSANHYPGTVHPQGFQYLKTFNASPFPHWLYGTDVWELSKSIFMVRHSNSTVLSYQNKGKIPVTLELHPLYAYANYHTTFHENPYTDFYTEFNAAHLKTYAHYGSVPLYTQWNLGEFVEQRAWYKNILLPIEMGRGLDDTADYYRIGYLTHVLQPGEQLTLCFTLEEPLLKKDKKKLVASEKRRLTHSNKVQSNFYTDLLRVGNQFLVHRQSTHSTSVIAGYHWFTDWGRDTMIAMRGLTIATGKKQISKSILTTFLNYVDEGMIPNRFTDHLDEGGVEYNTIDATLWLFVALYDYHQKFNDLPFLKKQINVLKEILDYHIKGTRYHIQATQEGFLYGGEQGVQLTWMDAKVGGEVITPRIGCPVEVNALWYNALKIYEYFGAILNMGKDATFSETIVRFEANFEKLFTNAEGTLFDVVVPHVSTDNSFRPNQIYGISLPFSLVGKNRQKTIFKAVKKKLYTPFGLRTLDMENPEFQGTYQGNQWSRDHAYHQGTVWPFLLYEYYAAYFKIYGATKNNKKKVVNELVAIKEHFYSKEGMYCISEVFDGKNPNEGKGCLQQAWSVGALIKLYEDFQLYEI